MSEQTKTLTEGDSRPGGAGGYGGGRGSWLAGFSQTWPNGSVESGSDSCRDGSGGSGLGREF